MEQWPNFFLVGAPRAGTTSMYEFLKRTPGVYMSPMKEPHYFSSIDPRFMFGKVIRDKKKYLMLFKNVKNEIAVGECSTSYLSDPKSCELIHQTIPHARIVIMLRDPIHRAFSHYLMRVGGGQTHSFSEVIRLALESPKQDYYNSIIVNGSFYAEQVKRYLDVFGSNQVKIIIFEEFIKNEKKFVKDLLIFLGVDNEPPEKIKTIHNEYTIPRGKLITTLLRNKIVRQIGEKIPVYYYEPFIKNIMGKKIPKPKVSFDDKFFLDKLFKDDVKKLTQILDRELPWSVN